MTAPNTPQIIHATTISHHGRAAVIVGPSGAGKSSLALQLISLGAELVSDDRTVLSKVGGTLRADTPEAIAGLIEARGVGLLRIGHTGAVPVALVIDLSQTETLRLPHPHTHDLCGLSFPCLHNAPSPHFAAAILFCLSGSVNHNA